MFLMIDDTITIAGIVVPTDDPRFLAVLAIHVPAGLVCVIAGAIAMFSRKKRGNHTRAGLVYYRSLMVVFATMTALAAMRWAHAYHLFALGLLSFAAAIIGRRRINGSTNWRVRAHVIGMGASYVVLLIAFYVDNGRNLPLWKNLPAVSYWALPLAIGVPLIARAVRRHPLARSEKLRSAHRSA